MRPISRDNLAGSHAARQARVSTDGVDPLPGAARPGVPRQIRRPASPPPALAAAPVDSGPARSTRVFVCYAHDNARHKRLVTRLCVLLDRHGVQVRVDQWASKRRQDWSLWALREIRAADFVLVIASPMCRKAGDGLLGARRHPGIQSELALLREHHHADRAAWQRRILPVILPGGTLAGVPLFLLPHIADHYTVTGFTPAGARELLAALAVGPRRPRSHQH